MALVDKISMMNMENALNIVRSLYCHGYAAYFVGGFVRDRLIGVSNYDVDVTTNAKPDEIIEVFPNEKVDLVGKSFGVVMVNGVEVATFRKDRYFGLSDKNCHIEPGTIMDDASRRDFTFNSLYFDPFTGTTIDFFDGKTDLKNKIVRFVGESQDRIFEDPVRIIRACRFLAKIDGSFAPETLEALKANVGLLEHVAPERIRLEVLKALEAPARRFFEALDMIGALPFVFPSLQACHIDGGQYHEESVFEHNILTGDAITAKNPLLRLAGYLHDVGKPVSEGVNPLTGEKWFKDHAETGVEVVERELTALKFSNDEIRYVSSLVKFHMNMTRTMGPKAVRKLLRNLNEVGLSWEDLLRLRLADKQGNLKNVGSDVRGMAKEYIKKFWTETRRKNLPLTVKDLAVDGNDVMKELGIPPGPKVGEVLAFLLNFVLEDPDKNEREFLLYEMKTYFGGKK